MSGVTGGTFILSFTWLGSVYTTPSIAWNATGDAVISALNSSVNVLGQSVDAPSWMTPITPAQAPDWANGPLPVTPVVVEATGRLGGQVILPFQIIPTLTGSSPTLTARQFRGGGTRLDIWAIGPSQVAQLLNATCAQAEYRDQMGEDFYIKAQWDSVSGPEFRTTGRLPLIGPKAMRELQGSGLIQYSGRARITTRAGRTYAYMPVGGTPIPDDWRAV